ncbi:MAG: tetratricopeptide repeat protein [Planctomycetota bacterium]|nr:tetratricopeptide repeat protein [Planctomycetota bacterium]
MTRRLAQLWQLPLLLFSLFLFGYAGWLLAKPKAALTVLQRVEVVRQLLKQDRAEASIEQLNGMLNGGKLKPEMEGGMRVLLGEALQMAQRQRRLNIPANHQRIIEQTQRGMALGIAGNGAIHGRLGESYEALGRVGEAIWHYQRAAELDPGCAMKVKRKVIELQLGEEDREPGEKSIEQYLAQKELSDAERAWAMGEKAHIWVDRGAFKEAKALLAEAVKLDVGEGLERGEFTYWMGYCEWKLGDLVEAERLLRVARDLLRVQHPLDADAAYGLGRIRQEQKDFAGANSFYAAVMQSHLDSRVAPAAKLNRGICRIAQGDDEAGLSDLQSVAKYVVERPGLGPRLKGEVVLGLQEGMQLLVGHANYMGALEGLAYEQELQAKPGAEFFERLGRVYEKRAEQLEGGMVELAAGEKGRREQQVRDCRTKAGDAYVAVSAALTVTDDKGHGAGLWKAIELYERAGELPRVIGALERFVKERPEDPQTPAALFKLGQSYQAAGLFDKAIEAYRKNQNRYSRSLAASKSGVPLARAYIAKGPDFYRRAEEVLKAAVEDNPQITPEAEEFRESLWELANLYYRTGRYEQAISRLEELTQRYPNDQRMGQLLFLMASSYRSSAVILDDRIGAAKSTAASKPVIDLVEATLARVERLNRGKGLYRRVIDYYRANAPVKEMDRLYLKLSCFCQADCTYDMGDYVEAIKLYGDAAFRYQDDVLSLGAYVQIVNANVAMGKPEEAKAANERAMWMLRRMPAEAFSENVVGMSRPYWEQRLKWAGESGMWK